MKRFFKYLIVFVGVVIIAAGVFIIFGVPKILNSAAGISKIEQILSDKIGADIDIKGFNFKYNKNLSFDIIAAKIDVKDNDKQVVDFKNIEYHSKPLSFKPEKLNIESIYLDFERLKPRLNTDKKEDKSSLKIDYLPVINVKNAYVKFDDKSNMKLVNIHSEKIYGTVFCAFTGYLTVPYSKEPIVIGEDGYLYFAKTVNFEDFTLRYKTSTLNLTGTIDNLNFNGKDLSVYDLEKFFVFFYKTKNNGKRNFIENFENFEGSLDVDLAFSKEGLNGKCRAHNLKADFSKFKIPVSLPVVDFYFTGREMKAAANGTFGTDKVYTDVLVKGLATDNVVVAGNVKSKLTKNFTKKYFEPVQIIGFADADVKYMTANHKVSIEYELGLAPGSNISTRFGSLDNTDKYRKISAKTLKTADKLFVKDYNYSIGEQKMLGGDGLFISQQGSFKPSYFTLKTNGEVPMLLVQSFVEDYITGGRFLADLKYDFMKKYIDGKLSLYDTHHRDFMYLKQADINVAGNKIGVNIDGKFFNEPIDMKLIAQNNLKDDIIVDDIEINLKRFYVKQGNISSVKSSIKGNSPKQHKPKEHNVIVKKGKIHAGEIIHSKFYLHDVNIIGQMKDNVVDFTIPETEYSNGILSAVGKYNIKKHASDIHFLASDIDSNAVATKIFNLPDQFEGTAFATLHMKTWNKLHNIHAHATFAIADGFMPKLGSREIIVNRSSSHKKSPLFFLKKSFKFTLSKVTNIDFSKPNIFYSNLRGSFILDDSCVHDVKIFSQSDNISMFVEGNYDIDSQKGDISLWGRRNKVSERKIRIFKIPLSLIHKVLFRVERTKEVYNDKIKLIPPIKGTEAETGLFRVLVNGNLNTNDIKIELKDIR